MSLFKHQWITQEVIDYLMSLPILYQILYVVRVNGNGSTSFLFRDDDGKMVANLYERDVIAVRIQYQDDPFFEDCPVGKILDKYSLPYMKRAFGEFMARRPTTQSDVKPKDLYMMQYTLRDSIERVTGVRGIYSDSKDIIVEMNHLPFENRKKFADFIARLDDKCVHVGIHVMISGSTDEHVGATSDELALYEMELTENETEDP